MSERLSIFDYLKASTRLRWRRIAIGMAIGAIISVVLVRQREAEYEAQVRLFAGLPTSTAVAGIGTPSNMFASLERDTLIMSQEALVRSESIFEAVNRAMRDRPRPQPAEKPMLSALVGDVRRRLKILLFGEEYVTKGERLSKPAFEAFQRRVTFDSALDAGTFTIGFRHAVPEVALEMVRSIATELISKNIDLANERWRSIAVFLREKLANTERQLLESNASIADFVRQNNVFDSAAVFEAKYRQLVDAQELFAVTEQQLSSSVASVGEIERALSDLGKRAGAQLSSGTEQRLDTLLAELKENENSLQQSYGLGPKQKSALEARNADLRRQLRETLRSENVRLTAEQLQQLIYQMKSEKSKEDLAIVGARAKLRAIESRVKLHESELKKLPDLQAQLQQKTVTHAQLQKVYEVVMQNYLNASIQSDVRVANIIVVDEPQIMTTVLGSSKARQLFSAGLMAAVIVLVGSGLLDLLRRKVVTRQQVQQRKDAEYAGSVDRIPARDLSRELADGDTFSRIAAVLAKRMGQQADRAQVIALTSHEPSSGKTTTAIGLANALKRRGARVLLLDVDVRAARRGAAMIWASLDTKHVSLTLATLLKLDPAAAIDPKVVVARVGLETQVGASIEAGLRAVLPTAVQQLMERFDYIILDCPPLTFGDTAVALEHADAIVACCREGAISEDGVSDMIHQVNQTKRNETLVFSVVTFCQSEGAARRNAALYYGSRNRAA